MPLFLSKQLRAEKKVISELRDKIKKSEKIKYVYDERTALHTYKLDNMVVKFYGMAGDVGLIVDNKSGKEIVNIKYRSWYPNNTKPRYRWLNRLWDFANKRWEKVHAYEIKQKKLKEAKEALDMSIKQKEAEEKQLAETLTALEKLRGM